MRSLILSIYVWAFGPFLEKMQASNKYMASRSSAKSLSFYFHTGLGHNFNIDGGPHPNPAVLTHTRSSSPIPGSPHPHPAVLIHSWLSPAVPLIFIDICPAVIPITCCLGAPPSLLPPYRLLMHPIVPRTIPVVLLSPLPSPKQPLSHMSHST